MYCPRCGVQIPDDSARCPTCGADLRVVDVETPAPAPAPRHPTAPAPPPTVPAPLDFTAAAAVASGSVAPAQGGNGERVHAIIPNTTLKSGFMGVKSRQHTLILTDRRVIFAQITMAMMKQLVADARDDAKSEGKGFFGQWGAQMSAYSAWAERYLEMSPGQALAETAGNFAVERSTITKTSLKSGDTYGDDANTTERLVIKTTGKKYELTLGSGAGQAKQALGAAGMI